MTKLEQAARQALEALEQNTYYNFDDDIKALREALDHSGEANEMVQGPVAWHDLGRAVLAFHELQLKCKDKEFADSVEEYKKALMRLQATKLYAAPVRTKDLTDDVNRLKRIAMIAHYGGLANMTKDDALTAIRKITIPYFDRDASDEEARAVIAADREKNRGL